MAALICLDTHVVAWLYAGRTDLIPLHPRRLLEEEPLRISPIVSLELQYLFEMGRTTVRSETILADLRSSLGLAICDLPFERVVAGALRLDRARDPFDRLNVSQATLRGAPLVTKDRDLLNHCSLSVWDREPP